ncbi:heterokaryon incompatibility protein [Colletotrichum sojae]|uniref:Heterokaryon incompatibility protein n=1 Tax=Colletotrichum sojae TaxID=2175907 RepID=A0A8H6IXS1_9PEZI|nr:heterokaryon incompatibility protein [Colletotrichum sojae]
MFIALELGIAYIWIDSLCIVQNLYDDWVYESKRMGDVYCYAECNIAASGSRDGTSGLFGERTALPVLHPTFPLKCSLFDEDGRAPEQNFHGFYTVADDTQFELQVNRSLLNSRAWVAQERALSPGIIHFTPEKVWWECSQMVADEAISSNRRFSYLDVGQTIRWLNAELRAGIYQFWLWFVERYAGSRITKSNDRFPAASGIARVLEEMLNENYIAGFWEGDLVRSLLWVRTDVVHDIPPIQLAPSWSWASMCGEIQSELNYFPESEVQFVEGVQIEALSEIPGFESDLKSPSVERSFVRGLAVKGPLRSLPPDLQSDPQGKTEDYMWLYVMMNHDREALKDVAIPEDRAWSLEEATHFLPLTIQLDHDVVTGLLLQEVKETTEGNEFRRCGVISFDFGEEDDVDGYLGLRKRNGNYEPSLRFEECGLQDIVLI